MPIVARNPPVVPKATEKKRRSGVIVASVVVAILVVAGIATAGYFLLRGTPAAPEVALLGASCIHEFCVTAPGNATVVPLSGTARELVHGTIPIVELSASPDMVVWSSPDDVAKRAVAFFALDRHTNLLQEYLLHGREGMSSVAIHGTEAVFAKGVNGTNFFDEHDSIGLWDVRTGQDRQLYQADGPVILFSYDGHAVLFIVGTPDGVQVSVLDVATKSVTAVGPKLGVDDGTGQVAAFGSSVLRDGVVYTLTHPADRSVDVTARINAFDLNTKSSSVVQVVNHPARWLYATGNRFVTGDANGTWLESTGIAERLGGSSEVASYPIYVASGPGAWLLLNLGPIHSPPSRVAWSRSGQAISTAWTGWASAIAATSDAGFFGAFVQTSTGSAASLNQVDAPAV